ncbi:MAG: 2-oxoglutarate oxidoreductase [Lewinellaceae bacterium]|nr:2-oxoglutarate oxidoreductase [Lewinellaceae bacterium]
MFGIKQDFICELPKKYFTLSNYEKGVARWCPGCGDHAVLSAVQRLCRDEQLPPEKTVFVSGIGCSSRFPHYMNTYGFHGLHGRAFPVACGVKFRRPDLNVFVITGDGDCCSIGAGAWIHAIRYNMNITTILFDNQIYGMTKKQTSPTSRLGTISNTHPTGSVLPPVNPLQTSLGMTNASFVAQTADWVPGHLFATIKAGYEHPGFAFIKVIMRCSKFMGPLVEEMTANRDAVSILTHENGIQPDDGTLRAYKHHHPHDPSDINAARELAEDRDVSYLGLFYQNKEAIRYDVYGAHNLGFTPEEKIAAVNAHLDKYAV